MGSYFRNHAKTNTVSNMNSSLHPWCFQEVGRHELSVFSQSLAATMTQVTLTPMTVIYNNSSTP